MVMIPKGYKSAIPVRQTTRVSSPGVVSTAEAYDSAARAMGGLAQTSMALTGMAAKAVGETAELYAKWQRQKEDGILADIKVQADAASKEYLTKIVTNKKGEKAGFSYDSREWNDYQTKLIELAKHSSVLSDDYKSRAESFMNSTMVNSVADHTTYEITEQRRYNVAKGKALLQMMVENAAGVTEKEKYMDNSTRDIADQIGSIYYGQGKEVIQSETGKVHTAMYISAIEDQIAGGEYKKAEEMLGKEKIEAYTKTLLAKYSEWGKEDYHGVAEDYKVIDGVTRKKFLELIERGREDGAYTIALHDYTVQLMPGGKPQGNTLDSIWKDIEEKTAKGIMTPAVASRLRSGLMSVYNLQLAKVREDTAMKVDEIEKSFIDASVDGSLTVAVVRNHPEARKYLSSHKYEYFLKMGQKIEGERSGAPTLPVDSPDVRRWREELFQAVDKGEIKKFTDISRYGSHLNGSWVQGWEDWYNLIPLTVLKEVESRLDKKTTKMTNYLDIAIASNGLKGDTEKLVREYASDFIYNTNLDEYDKGNREEIDSFVKGIIKAGVIKKGKDYTDIEIEAYSRRILDGVSETKKVLKNTSVMMIETPHSMQIATEAVQTGVSLDKLIDERAKKDGWVSPYYKGGLSMMQDERGTIYNSVGRSYGVDPSLLAVYDYIANEAYGEDPGRKGALLWSPEFEIKVCGRALSMENDFDNIEALGAIICEMSKNTKNLSAMEAIAYIEGNAQTKIPAVAVAAYIAESSFGADRTQFASKMKNLLNAKRFYGNFWGAYDIDSDSIIDTREGVKDLSETFNYSSPGY